MTRFIRPEARAALWRWREVIVGACLLVLGIWWVTGPGHLMAIIGTCAIVSGLALGVIGIQRGRFRTQQDGVGSVEVDEGQITYFGPLTGGSIAVRDVGELALLRTGVTSHWRLTSSDGQLFIPIDAQGADGLFDAFATLPGLNLRHLLKVMNDPKTQDTVIWSRGEYRSQNQPLH